MGHAEHSCKRLYATKDPNVEKPYGAWIMAPGRQAAMNIEERWLRVSPPDSYTEGWSNNSDGKGKEPAQEEGLSGQMGTTNDKASYNYDKQVIGGSRQGYNLDTVMELCNQHSLAQEGCAGSDVEGLIVAEVKRHRKEGTSNGEDEDGELQEHTHQACRPTCWKYFLNMGFC